jgi:uncharacterized membrane protein
MSNRSSQNTLRVPKPDSRHHRTFTILLSLVVTALSSGPATQSLYTFTAIDAPGSSHNDAQGINDRRQIVGSYIGDDLLPSVFILRRDGFSSLAITDVYTYGEAINNVGQAVVGSSAGHSYLWDDGVFIALPGAPEAAESSTAFYGINDHLQMVGSYGSSSGYRGFLYDDGTFTTINVPGTIATFAQGINNRGQIVGNYGVTDYFSGQRGFLLDKGIFTSIVVPNGSQTIVLGINDHGRMVGLYLDDENREHGFVYEDGEFTTIDFPGSVATFVSGINNRGHIVGQYSDGVAVRGFLATPTP